MRRAKVSTPPPGDTGTTMRIGRLGKTACARTITGASAAPAVARSDEIASRRFVEMILIGCPPTKGIAQIDTAALRDFDPANVRFGSQADLTSSLEQSLPHPPNRT